MRIHINEEIGWRKLPDDYGYFESIFVGKRLMDAYFNTTADWAKEIIRNEILKLRGEAFYAYISS